MMFRFHDHRFLEQRLLWQNVPRRTPEAVRRTTDRYRPVDSRLSPYEKRMASIQREFAGRPAMQKAYTEAYNKAWARYSRSYGLPISERREAMRSTVERYTVAPGARGNRYTETVREPTAPGLNPLYDTPQRMQGRNGQTYIVRNVGGETIAEPESTPGTGRLRFDYMRRAWTPTI